MAITDAYADAATYRTVISLDTQTEDQEITTDLTAVSRYMERKVGTCWNKDATAVTRVFQPKGGRHLFIDDLVSVTTLKVDTDADGSFADETAYAATDYELLPRNAVDGPEAHPYTCIYIPTWSTKSIWVPTQLVEINGIWGWPSVPDRVKRACIHLTAILRLETPRATRTTSELGEILETNPRAMDIVHDLIRVDQKVTV